METEYKSHVRLLKVSACVVVTSLCWNDSFSYVQTIIKYVDTIIKANRDLKLIFSAVPFLYTAASSPPPAWGPFTLL
jgi:hypothetical protein